MSVTVSAIEGNRQLLDGGAMFGNAPRPVWEKWIQPDAAGRIPLACRSMLLEVDGQRILCETGIGAFFEPKMADRFGVETPYRHLLRENLRALNIEESSIDFVILSHLHFDHAGGLLPTYDEIAQGRDQLLFPNARYVVGREAWARALKPHSRDKASFIPGLTEKLEQSKRLLIVEGSSHPDLLPNRLRFFTSQGHTPGQMLTLCRGDQKNIAFAGDLVPGLPWVHVPITMGYDRFPELLIDEKLKLYSEVATASWWMFFTHDPTFAMSQIRLGEKGRYEPQEPLKKVVQFQL